MSGSGTAWYKYSVPQIYRNMPGVQKPPQPKMVEDRRVTGAKCYSGRVRQVSEQQLTVRRRVGEYRRSNPHVKKTTLGRLMGFDGLLVDRLFDGTAMREQTLDKIEQWLDNEAARG